MSLEKQGRIGNSFTGSGEWLVAEADESDGTLVRYSPEIGVILNIGKDHKEIAELQEIFATFSNNITAKNKTLIVNEADELANAFSVNHLDDFGLEAKAIRLLSEFAIKENWYRVNCLCRGATI